MSELPEYGAQGASYFFTLGVAPEARITLTGNLDLLRKAYVRAFSARPFRTDAIVVLPDHLHAVWTLPQGDDDHSARWRRIREGFATLLSAARPEHAARYHWTGRGLWSGEAVIGPLGSGEELGRAIEHCWSDPVRHRYALKAEDWTASSIHRELREGRVAFTAEGLPTLRDPGGRLGAPALPELVSA